MRWRNSSTHYGLTSIALHWLVAVAVFGLFALGFWMVGLNYYSSWYRTAPDLHTRLTSVRRWCSSSGRCWLIWSR